MHGHMQGYVGGGGGGGGPEGSGCFIIMYPNHSLPPLLIPPPPPFSDLMYAAWGIIIKRTSAMHGVSALNNECNPCSGDHVHGRVSVVKGASPTS